jgi:hypothetical protein
MLMKLTSRVNLPKLLCKVQMYQGTIFGMKCDIQFHAQNCANYYQYSQLEVINKTTLVLPRHIVSKQISG